MKKSLFDLYNELYYVWLQVHDDVDKGFEPTPHDITLDVNGTKHSLPSTPGVVDHLKQAVQAAVPSQQRSDAEYLEQLIDFRKKLTSRVFEAMDNAGPGEPIEVPPVTIMFNGYALKMNLNADVFDQLDDLLNSEINEYR